MISPLKSCLTFCKSLNLWSFCFFLCKSTDHPGNLGTCSTTETCPCLGSKEAVWSAVEIAQLTPRNPGSCFVLFVTARGSPISLRLSCPHKAFPVSLTLQCLLTIFISPAYVRFIPLPYIKPLLSIFLSCWTLFFLKKIDFILLIYFLTFLKIDSLGISCHEHQSHPSPSPFTYSSYFHSISPKEKLKIYIY